MECNFCEEHEKPAERKYYSVEHQFVLLKCWICGDPVIVFLAHRWPTPTEEGAMKDRIRSFFHTRNPVLGNADVEEEFPDHWHIHAREK